MPEYMSELREQMYIGIIKLNTNEVLIASLEHLHGLGANETYMISDPLIFSAVPMMTSNGIQVMQALTPWLPHSEDRNFIITANAIVTCGEAKPEVFELYMQAITSDEYLENFSPVMMESIKEKESNKNTEILISDPVLKSFRNKLEKAFEK